VLWNGKNVSEEPAASIFIVEEVTLKVAGVCSSESLLPIYQITWRHVSDDQDNNV
jgi:hypothetical protein